jgi:hypothetical protein
MNLKSKVVAAAVGLMVVPGAGLASGSGDDPALLACRNDLDEAMKVAADMLRRAEICESNKCAPSFTHYDGQSAALSPQLTQNALDTILVLQTKRLASTAQFIDGALTQQAFEARNRLNGAISAEALNFPELETRLDAIEKIRAELKKLSALQTQGSVVAP